VISLASKHAQLPESLMAAAWATLADHSRLAATCGGQMWLTVHELAGWFGVGDKQIKAWLAEWDANSGVRIGRTRGRYRRYYLPDILEATRSEDV
jgi:hypothetical protein